MARDDDEDAQAPSRKRLFEPKPLDALSIAELEDYITDLKGEISRSQEMIERKRRVRAGADSLFGKKTS
jgi:uncharacterized small protein (DUF1192 family)